MVAVVFILKQYKRNKDPLTLYSGKTITKTPISPIFLLKMRTLDVKTSYILFFFGHLSFIKNITQTAVTNIMEQRMLLIFKYISHLTFRNIHMF